MSNERNDFNGYDYATTLAYFKYTLLNSADVRNGETRGGFNIDNHYFSEIDKHAIAIYQQNFKEAKYAGSVTDTPKVSLDTPYSMGSAKPNRSTIGCRPPEVGSSDRSIRRLTENECERLQGFPDNWTEYGNYEGEVKKVSATQRYKCLGNAVTVDVVEAVGKAILFSGAA